ncbi:uncharacterized protein LOC120323340 [Pipra filicauda]|uniref:Uncharacterized protein LOC120323340 n=1 Tax=Pipra filicauda TaxID=649802 RepID=A0A7R5K802_9PASS|nr:uncharacterized protein LOC120323340 [Pipra filicauda]
MDWGDERSQILDPLWPTNSRASSDCRHLGYAINSRKQPLADLWEKVQQMQQSFSSISASQRDLIILPQRQPGCGGPSGQEYWQKCGRYQVKSLQSCAWPSTNPCGSGAVRRSVTAHCSSDFLWRFTWPKVKVRHMGKNHGAPYAMDVPRSNSSHVTTAAAAETWPASVLRLGLLMIGTARLACCVKVVMMQMRKSFEKLHLRHWGLEKLAPQPLWFETNGKLKKKSEKDENCGFKKVV